MFWNSTETKTEAFFYFLTCLKKKKAENKETTKKNWKKKNELQQTRGAEVTVFNWQWPLF